MDVKSIYEYFLTRISEDASPDGYKRCGKSFYRLSAEGKVGCAIEMQRSSNNTVGSCSFTFNLACVALYELRGYGKKTLTREALRLALRSPDTFIRIGHVSRRRDYWWEITEDIMAIYTPSEYYERFIRQDIEKAVLWLRGSAERKKRIYQS